MNLSEHFSLRELCKTKTGIDNVPNEEQVENLKRLCRWLERLRKRWNDLYGEGDDPIIINSGFRSPAVNKAVGGATLSNHLTGCAVDIRCVGIEQAIRYATLLLDISDLNHEDFDELIIERKGYSYTPTGFTSQSVRLAIVGVRIISGKKKVAGG